MKKTGVTAFRRRPGASSHAQHLQHEGDPHHDDRPADTVSTNTQHVCLLLFEVICILPGLQSFKPDCIRSGTRSFVLANFRSSSIYNIRSIFVKSFRTSFRFFRKKGWLFYAGPLLRGPKPTVEWKKQLTTSGSHPILNPYKFILFPSPSA